MNLSAYFPRVITEWQREAPSVRSRVFHGSLVFMDISGFTAMSERLAKKGKVGAEEITDILDERFSSLLEAAYLEGGSLLKFGGDAMLLLFVGEQHERRACRAAAQMRTRLNRTGRVATSNGTVRLRMSVGVHSGEIHMFLVGSSHRELIVAGPAVTRTVEMEGAAAAGEIRVSEVTARALPEGYMQEAPGGGWLLTKAPAGTGGAPAPAPAQRELAGAERFISPAIRAHLTATSARESEHRYAVVCFIHYEGVDGLLERGGVAAVERALSELVETVQRATDEHGLCFLASDIDRDGGKIIVTGGVPTTSGSDEEGMLRAVTQILAAKTELHVRIGINGGPVFAGDIGPAYRRTYTIMGDTVNLAARLMARAGVNEAITVTAVVDRSRTAFDVAALEPFMVKGKAQPVTAVALGQQRGRRSAQEDIHLPLVGREQELGLLTATLADVQAGHRAIVDIVGEAGIGKSRLVDELRFQAAVAMFDTTCEQYESSTAYFPLRRLFGEVLGIEITDRDSLAAQLAAAVGRIAPELIDWLPLIALPFDVPVAATPTVDRVAARFRQGQTHRVLSELLSRAVPGPAVFFVEDAHWMDDASREFFSTLLNDAADRAWLHLFTRRPGPQLLADVNEDAVTMVLEPLSRPAAEALVAAAIGDAPFAHHELKAVVDRAAGNPFFLREMTTLASGAQGTGQELPDTVEALLATQLDRLSGEERRVLRYASVVGATFNTHLLEESLGKLLHGSVEATCLGLSSFLVRAGRDLYRFRHGLVRESAYNGLPYRQRRALHARLGLSIEARHGRRAESRAELLSLHFSRARIFDKALRYSRLAGDRAKLKSANVDAAEFYRRAIEAAPHVEGVTLDDQASLCESLSDVCELAAMYDDAAHALAQARRCLGRANGMRRLLRKEGVIRERLGKYSEALRWYGRGLNAASGADAMEIPQLQLAYAGVRFRQGQYADCARWCLRVIPVAESTGDRANLAHAYYLLDHAYTMLGSAKAGQYRSLALPVFEELGDFIGQANVHNNLGVSATIDGDWDDALVHFRSSQDARERVGDIVGAATATNNIGEVLLDRGFIAEAEPLFREALQVWRGADYAVGVAVATSALGLAATRAGRFDEGRALLEDALERFRDIGAESFVMETGGRLAELHLAADNLEEAQRLVERTLSSSKANKMGALTAQLCRLRGFVSMRQMRWEDARDALEESVRLARSMSAEYELALSLEARARLARATSEDPRSFERESSTILKRLGVAVVPLTDIPLSAAPA